jgi:hypothetical protein
MKPSAGIRDAAKKIKGALGIAKLSDAALNASFTEAVQRDCMWRYERQSQKTSRSSEETRDAGAGPRQSGRAIARRLAAGGPALPDVQV